jgi:hypothetical protein
MQQQQQQHNPEDKGLQGASQLHVTSQKLH